MTLVVNQGENKWVTNRLEVKVTKSSNKDGVNAPSVP